MKPQRKARIDAKGREISIPKADLNPSRLALKPFSWERQPEEPRRD